MIKLTPVTLILILVPFLSFVSPSCFMFTPLSVFYVFSLSIIPFYLFIFSFLFLSFPLAFLRAGHQVTSLSPHTCIQSTLYECVCLCVWDRGSLDLCWISILISTSVNEQSYYRKGGQKGHFTTSPSLSLSRSLVSFHPSIPLSLRRQINHLSNASWKQNFFLALLNLEGGVYLSFTLSPHTPTHPLSFPLLFSLLVLERLMCFAAKDVRLHP